MVQNIWDNGKMTRKTVLGLKHGLMDHFIRASFIINKNKEKVHISGIMDNVMKDNFI
jgi:hypothetical protein